MIENFLTQLNTKKRVEEIYNANIKEIEIELNLKEVRNNYHNAISELKLYILNSIYNLIAIKTIEGESCIDDYQDEVYDYTIHPDFTDDKNEVYFDIQPDKIVVYYEHWDWNCNHMLEIFHIELKVVK